ncbi:tyrosine-type recombinase/integrase [Caminibacter pacificus]|nr:site-specific integrase [Caminibacter pacificus]ROR40943.1 site-specific recombinase XerD [Caminibacter pacificus]
MTLREIKALKWNGKRELYRVEQGLYVEVLKNKKVYRLLTKKNGKQIKATLCDFDEMSLTDVKKLKDKILLSIRDMDYNETTELIRKELGIRESKRDKVLKTKKAKEREKFLLKNIIQEFLVTRTRQEQNRIQNYIIRLLGDKDVREITKRDIIDFFQKVKTLNVNPKQTTYQSNKMATIKRLKNNLNLFYKYLYLKYDVEHNPIANLTMKDIERLLGEKYQVTHFKATTNITDIQELYFNIWQLKTDYDVKSNKHKATSIYTKYALMFLILSALRNGTLRRLTWDMVNWKKEVIEIPGEITKTKKDFRLPLSNTMRKILEDLKQIEKHPKGLIFKGKNGEVMSENTLNAKIKKLSDGKTTAHGIRSTFSTILKERGENPLYIEEQLMHVVENKVGQAYTRTDYLEQRRHLLKTWAFFVTAKVDSYLEKEKEKEMLKNMPKITDGEEFPF